MKSKWIASLSDGQTIDELKGFDGNKIRWVELVKYIQDNDLELRHVKLVVNGIEYNAPTFNTVGRFNNHGNLRGAWICRRMQYSPMSIHAREDNYIDMSYFDGQIRHHIIINEDTNVSWQSTSSTEEGWHKACIMECGEDW